MEAKGLADMPLRVSNLLERIFNLAQDEGLIETYPATRLTGLLQKHEVQHRKMLPLEQLPELLQLLSLDGANNEEAQIAQRCLRYRIRPNIPIFLPFSSLFSPFYSLTLLRRGCVEKLAHGIVRWCAFLSASSWDA